jgi:hypothetical protein
MRIGTIEKMMGKRVLAIAIGVGCAALLCAAAPLRAQSVPHYKVDGLWPKTLPNNWLLTNTTGLVVDKNDHVWVLNRPRMTSADDAAAAQTPPVGECCVPAPSLVLFDGEGNVLKSWGGPNYVPDWPILEHGLAMDKAGNFWIGGNYFTSRFGLLTAPPKPKENPLEDRHILKFSPDGKQLLEIGKPSNAAVNNQDTSLLGSPSEFELDEAAHEIFIADGYINSRIVVYDSETGAFKRGWGAYGMPLSEIDNGKAQKYDPNGPTPKQFLGPLIGLVISEDGLVYVSDRTADRVQVFTKEGKYVKEFLVHPKTLGLGTAQGLMLSKDAKQKFLWVADGENGVLRILNREDGMELGTVGHKGREAGQFESPECMALDSDGNLYTTEVGSAVRIQKFVPVK